MLTESSAVFQAGGLVVVLVEVNRKPYLASIVPVIVNAILNEHQIIVDIVAFVNKGDFPRSRLGEKQRGKILAGWVTRKLRTLAQFAIRDVDPAALGEPGSAGPDAPDGHRGSMVSVRSGGIPVGTSSLRNVEHAPQIPEHEEYEPQMQYGSQPPPPMKTAMELPDEESTMYAYTQRAQHDLGPQSATSQPPGQLNLSYQGGQDFQLPDFNRFGTTEPEQGSSSAGAKPDLRSMRSQAPPQIRLPGVDGREALDLWQDSSRNGEDDDDWQKNAIMHMNLAGSMNPRP